MTFEEARDELKKEIHDEYHLEAALRVAMELIGNYQSDIANVGIRPDCTLVFSGNEPEHPRLESLGFCQGEFYKDCQKLLKPWEVRQT